MCKNKFESRFGTLSGMVPGIQSFAIQISLDFHCLLLKVRILFKQCSELHIQLFDLP
ncbi:hypothetical protein D3C77_367600 [compost metagenome]